MLPTAEIKVNPDNFRDDAAPVPGIVENLETDGPAGLLSPVIVIADPDGGYLLLDGEQRYLSTVEAKQEWIQAIVRDDLAGRAAQLITMLRSIHRKDPTGAQQARGIKQLVLEGLDVEAIAQRTGFQPEQVKASVQAADLDKKTTKKMHDLGLDLVQFGVVGEFAGDKAVVDKLVEAAKSGPFAFNRAVEYQRKERQAHEAVTARRAELTAAGVRLLDTLPSYNDPRCEQIDNLRTRDDKRLTARAHTSCPGRAVYVGVRHGDPTEHEYCTDWRANGHTKVGARKTGAMSEEEKAERRWVIQNNKLMDAANEARRNWLAASMFASQTPPKGAMRYIAETLADGSAYVLAQWLGAKRGLDALLDPNNKRRTDGYLPARTSDARCIVVALAAIGAAHEDRITRESWRHPAAEDARWLSFLAANGYEPGEVEQSIIDGHARKATARRAHLTVVKPAGPTSTTSDAEPDGEEPTETAPGQADAPGERIEPDDEYPFDTDAQADDGPADRPAPGQDPEPDGNEVEPGGAATGDDATGSHEVSAEPGEPATPDGDPDPATDADADAGNDNHAA